MATIPGSVPVRGFVAPGSTTDTYPAQDSQFELGGHHEAADYTARNAIPAARRREGMICSVNEDHTEWQLQGGITDACWVNVTSGGGSWSPEIQIEYGNTFATNQPFKLLLDVAQHVTSLDGSYPYVDGITLESGTVGDTRPTAMVPGVIYTTPLALPAGTTLYLGQDGRLTATEPSSLAGDVWYLILVRVEDSTHFIFTPETPIKLA